MAITAAMVKELREMTGAGMMDCKKALTECDGDLTKASEWLREKGISKAAKKAGRIAAEGLAKVVTDGNWACMVEMNSETDFVAKNEMFLTGLNTIANAILANKPADLDAALAIDVDGQTVNDIIVNETATIGEKITLRRFQLIEKADGECFGVYAHNGGKIVAVTVVTPENAEVAKFMAMQVASMKPEYVSRDAMPAEVVEKERHVQMEIVKNDPSLASKPEKVLAGIVEGRVSKSLQEICLMDQIYFMDQGQKVGQYLKSVGASVKAMYRYTVGEGIEKRQENFAEEVADAFK